MCVAVIAQTKAPEEQRLSGYCSLLMVSGTAGSAGFKM